MQITRRLFDQKGNAGDEIKKQRKEQRKIRGDQCWCWTMSITSLNEERKMSVIK